jgi:DNA-binding CsgD family transcriptional regulator
MMTAAGVIGRDSELATLCAFLDGLVDSPAALVLEGDAGVGKTTLWRAGIDAALERSFRVLSASPAEAETGMSFAALGDLLADTVDEVLPELPPPQGRALEVALLLTQTEGPGPAQHVVAVAFLTALRVLSASAPVLVAVDDVQWLDAGTASVVAYAGRRLREERIGLLLAERTAESAGALSGSRHPLAQDQVTSIRIGPFTLGALHRLLHWRLGHALPRPALRRIHETAGGNPFYALEIARALGPGFHLAPGQPLPVPQSLGELLRGRIAALSPETRETLLLAAALSEPRLGVLAAAIDADPRSVLRPAIEAQVIGLEGDRIRFAHPLLASAAYGLAEDAERREAHARLAGIVEEQEERARHLALAAEGPNERVADALERASSHAQARGATAAAAELSEQAARLTPPHLLDDVQRRAVAAARYAFIAGDSGRARVLLEQALPATRPGGVRAEAFVLLGLLDRYEGHQPQAVELLQAALAEPGADERIRADAAQGLASTLFFMREDLGVALAHAELAAELAEVAGSRESHVEALAMKGLIEGVLGRPEAEATLRIAEQLGEHASVDRVDSSATWSQAYAKLWTDEAGSVAPLMRRCYDAALALGHESSVANILTSLALAEYLAGHWEEAARIAQQGHEAALQGGQQHYEAFSLSVLALVRASLGLEDQARTDADRALALAGERSMAVARIHGVWALGLLELSLHRPDETVRMLAPERERLWAAGVGEPGAIRFLADEIEALVELGRLREAEGLVSWLEERGRALDRAWAVAAAGRCRGLLADARGEKDGALAAFERALTTHERVPLPFDRARTLLALGFTQRRSMKRSAARGTLTEALASFEELGAALWVATVRAELARIGGRSPGGWELTPTEQRVAELVGDGLTNREVAARLHLTQKTIEFHLRNVFRKLGVRSRTELARSPGLKH